MNTTSLELLRVYASSATSDDYDKSGNRHSADRLRFCEAAEAFFEALDKTKGVKARELAKLAFDAGFACAQWQERKRADEKRRALQDSYAGGMSHKTSLDEMREQLAEWNRQIQAHGGGVTKAMRKNKIPRSTYYKYKEAVKRLVDNSCPRSERVDKR